METESVNKKGVFRSRVPAGFLFTLAVLTFIAALVTFVLNFPYTLTGIQSEWGIRAAYPAVEARFSLEGFGLYFLVGRYFTAAIVIAGAAVFLIFGRRQALAPCVATLLSAVGPALGLAGDSWESRLSLPFDRIFETLNLYFIVVFIFGALYLGQVYPERKYVYPWVEIIAPWSRGCWSYGS